MPYLEIIALILLILSTISFFSLAPRVPTKGFDLDRINDVVGLKSGEKFLEIGCGTAKVSIFVAKKNPDFYITGVELSLLLFLISKIKVFLSRQKNIKIIYGNALKQNLENFDVIYVFGLPDTITKKIFPKINLIKNKNFRLISYCFKMTNDYFEETKFKEEGRFAIYEYKIN